MGRGWAAELAAEPWGRHWATHPALGPHLAGCAPARCLKPCTALLNSCNVAVTVPDAVRGHSDEQGRPAVCCHGAFILVGERNGSQGNK